MSKKQRLCLAILCSLWAFALVSDAQNNSQLDLDRQYQLAVSHYEAGRYTDAAAVLEPLLPYATKSFATHELLGQVYALLSDSDRAIEQLQEAVRLKPDSGPARTNLATALFHAGKTEAAGEQFRKALALEPRNYDANHNLGEFNIQSGKIDAAIPLLERAQSIRPGAYDNGFDLAQANLLSGRLAQARQVVQALVKEKNTAELHNLLGQIEENDGKFVAAVNEFQTAAQMDPSDDNLFDWGCELLLHRTYEPAIEVFEQASRRYPNSPRLKIGLGLALYSRGKYDEAVKVLLVAADLSPSDPRCYTILSRAYDSSPGQASEVIRRFQRYAELQPNNALAKYYLAMSLWKGKRAEESGVDLTAVETLLRQATSLDDSLSDAHMQLGNFYADQREYAKSIPLYLRALELEPNLADTHYRLGQDYVHTGQKEQAQKEFEVYQKLRAEHLAEVDKERAEVQQFVYSEKAGSTPKP